MLSDKLCIQFMHNYYVEMAMLSMCEIAAALSACLASPLCEKLSSLIPLATLYRWLSKLMS